MVFLKDSFSRIYSNFQFSWKIRYHGYIRIFSSKNSTPRSVSLHGDDIFWQVGLCWNSSHTFFRKFYILFQGKEKPPKTKLIVAKLRKINKWTLDSLEMELGSRSRHFRPETEPEKNWSVWLPRVLNLGEIGKRDYYTVYTKEISGQHLFHESRRILLWRDWLNYTLDSPGKIPMVR